jgi:hypothetical protein
MDDPTDIVLGVPMALDELPISFRLLERVQILALDILDQRQLGRSRFIDFPDDRRDGMEASPLRRAPTPLTGDNLEIISVWTKQNGLENATLADRFGELLKRIFIEVDSGLRGVWLNPRDLDLSNPAAR